CARYVAGTTWLDVW
nr:immunoglobulin heavy chain junction region [Macaca mulatta]MOW26791.1 immunoglobulin heavy chain junction region [Macaca mulatta]